MAAWAPRWSWSGPSGLSPPRLLDPVRAVIRLRLYNRRTGKAYAGWVRRFVLFHDNRHPATMGEVSRSPVSRRRGQGRPALSLRRLSTANAARGLLRARRRVPIEPLGSEPTQPSLAAG
ncbi:MAG TPA: phage integrase N-terminal SAM-like domain-containing protein [Candidatus Limnocylindria bacterium]|nr:phage integrase N-terminal SAM-like domain-containing protein [Candidatus Limnocylindria bacterium]